MSTITSGTVLGAGLLYDSDTTGNLVIKTGASANTAATFHGNAVTTFNGNIHTGTVYVGNVKLNQTDFYGSFTANGWQRFPGGLIIQWGSIPASSTTSTGNIAFSIPFPSAVFSVTAQDVIAGSDAQGFDIQTGLTFGGPTINGFSYSKQARGFYWMAIGN
jgi:hypothetical protein